MKPSQTKKNQNEPPISFRCSSPEAKQAIQQAAKDRGQTVNSYLRELVEGHVNKGQQTPSSNA